MRTKYLLLFLFLLLLGSCEREYIDIGEGRTCATQEVLLDEFQKDPSLEGRMKENELMVQHLLEGRAETALSVTIPVVVHIVYNTTAQNISDAQVQSQIDVLNKDFARQNLDAGNTPNAFKPVAGASGIRFCLATKTPSGAPTKGIERRYTTKTSWAPNGAFKLYSQGGLDAWDSRYYLNIWVINLSGSLGYATYPGGNPIADGVAIRTTAFGTGFPNLIPQYNRGRTATHEVAHWLNLYHIWGDAQCGNDKVDDTPVQNYYNYGCPVFPKVTCNNGPNGDMFMNYMDYTNDACMNLFTKQQVSRMDMTLMTLRSPILSSNGCK